MDDRDQIRWLLRVLAEPPFLRLYVEGIGSGAYERRRFEDAFWSLEPDLEHPAAARDAAWRRLESWLPDAPIAPADVFRTVLVQLSSGAGIDQAAVRDLARFWSLPDLFPASESPVVTENGPNSPGYRELHAHLRGSVPYLHLWESWLGDLRWRANLRTLECRAGAWSRTWAELVGDAAESWRHLASLPALQSASGESPSPVQSIRNLADIIRADSFDEKRHAACYLALCTGLRRRLLHQRGHAGLSEFTASYGCYASIQKAPVRAIEELRSLVPAIMRRFEHDGVVAVELRPTLERTRVQIQQKFEAVVWGYFDYLAESEHPVLLGLVPSLYKQEGVDRQSDMHLAATWQRQSEIWCEQVDALLAILDDIPALRWFVVGLDAAGRERGSPPRALKRALTRVRRYHERHGLHSRRPGRSMAIQWLRELAQRHQDNPGEALGELNTRRHISRERLGVTLHAGEDFVDPMTGLRHIWESLDVLVHGDRIGHALAAGLTRDLVVRLLERRSREPRGDVQSIDPHRFRLRKPRGEHLLDLAWLRSMHLDRHDAQRFWEASLSGEAATAQGGPADGVRLASALNAADAPVGILVPSVHYADAGAIMPHDLTWVTVDETWFETFERLRRRVGDELRRRHIVVESCPSSNLAVAGMHRPPLEVFLDEGIPCVVATDDPGLLGVWPAEELRIQAATEQRERLRVQTIRSAFVR